MAITIVDLDHLVLTVRDIGATCAFYADALGAEVVEFGEGRTALHFGRCKINLHQAGAEFSPRAAVPEPGAGDFCVITETPLEHVIAHLVSHGIEIELGPVERQGARGAMMSVYFRDPDGNLVEVASYADV